MRRAAFTMIAAVTVSCAALRPGPALAGLSGELLNTFRTNSLEGENSQSFTKNDLSSVSELRLMQNTRLSEDTDLSWNLSGRASNDPNIEARDWSLINLSARLTSRGHRLDLGNFAPAFTEFTLSQPVIGIGYGRTLPVGDGLTIHAVGGATASTWNTWLDNERLSDYRQYTGGLRLVQGFAGNSEAGVSVVHTFEDEDSVAGSPFTARKNTVVSGDVNLSLARRFSVSAEAAASVQNYDLNRSSGDLSPLALQMDARYGFRQARFGLRYYRAGSDFDPLSGAASPDSEQWKLSWRQTLSRSVNQYLSFNFRRNNLENKLAAATNVTVPAVGWEFQLSQPWRMNVDLRFEDRDSAGTAQNNNSFAVGANLTKPRASLATMLEYRSQRSAGEPDHAVYVTGLNLNYRLDRSQRPLLATLTFSRTDDYLSGGGTAGITQALGGSLSWKPRRDLSFDGGYAVNTFRSSLAGSRGSRQNTTRLALNYSVPLGGMLRLESAVEYDRRELAYVPSNNDSYADNIVAARFGLKF